MTLNDRIDAIAHRADMHGASIAQNMAASWYAIARSYREGRFPKSYFGTEHAVTYWSDKAATVSAKARKMMGVE